MTRDEKLRKARQIYAELRDARSTIQNGMELIAALSTELGAIVGDDKELKTVKCKGCDQLIGFVKSKNNKSLPVNPGLVTIVTAEGQTVRGRISHFATCPKASDFRRPKNGLTETAV